MAQYMDEIPPDVISPHDSKAISDPLLKHLDTVIALYDFPGTQPSHLPLSLGDTIYVLSKSDTGWWDGVVFGSSGDLQRGWFPHNYVRSVNYVQPVLNKLKSNKELDSITAANTAANVLIPLFTNLLQKNLLESEKPSPATNTRKNSVVSFASSDTSMRSGNRSGTPTMYQGINLPSQQVGLQSELQSGPQSEPQSELQSGPQSEQEQDQDQDQEPHGRGQPSITTITAGDLTDALNLTSLEEAERIVEEYRKTNDVILCWIPKCTVSGDFVFYCEQLDIYCGSMPMTTFDRNSQTEFKSPTVSAIEDKSIIPSEPDNLFESRGNNLAMFDSLKRDSNASTTSQSSSSSYHHFTQPFFAFDYLFYKQASDMTKWSELKESFNYLLDLTYKALKDQNKQLFSTHFTHLNKLISLVFSAARLTRDDFIDTKFERSVKRRLKRIASSFSQLYINGVLHLNVMHFKGTMSEGLLMSRLNQPVGSFADSQSSVSTVIQDAKHPSNLNLNTNLNSLHNGQKLTLNEDDEFISYFHQVEIEAQNLGNSMNSLTNIFIKITDGKRVMKSDYDSSDASEDEGVDRSDILPQLYPRFLTDEFNGGNWCNPFFATSNSALNVSGDDLKNKHHQKVIIDHTSFELVVTLSDKMVGLSEQTLEYLDTKVQHNYYNESLKNERNTQILRLIYKYLFHSSSLMDLIESFDFTVFCLVKKYSSSSEEDSATVKEKLSKGDTTKEDIDIPSSNLTFDYPIVLEFFQLKQKFHDLISLIIMSTQSLTLEDPDVFKGLKDEDPLFYNRDLVKMPTEKAAILLTNILIEQSDYSNSQGNTISLDADSILAKHLIEGIDFMTLIQKTIRQLIDERETILNYATRVLHDDLNVQLLVMERNNTMLFEKAEEGHSYYSGEQKEQKDVPWYLEGDEEYDLLLDMKGNIKGGTKEALVAHLTHHDLVDTNFNSAMLIAFATIMSLGELIASLINRYNIEAPEGLSFEEYNLWISKKQNPIRLRVLNIMILIVEKYWTESYQNELVIKRWFEFSQGTGVQSHTIGKQLSQDLSRLLAKEIVCIPHEPMIPTTKAPAVLTKGSSFLKKMKLMDIDPIELARQLTLREFNLYSKITKSACIAKVWGKKSGLNESYDSITSFIRASNQLTNFVSYMILRKNESKKRGQVIRYFVQVAEKCRQYNNFSSMTAIISALYSSPIQRLKKTWQYLSPKTSSHLQNMNKLMNSSRNFNEYRDVLKFIGSEACVPFFGVYLSDLTFVFHGNPDCLMNRTRLINFAKRSKTCEIVTGIDRFKTLGYNFTNVIEIQKYLDTWFEKCPTISEQYQLSLALEPREPPATILSTSKDSAPSNSTSANSNSRSYKGQKISLGLSSGLGGIALK
jgi:son of sevenless-like protein